MAIKTKLSHVTLYAKKWYKRSENIYDDLRKCLTADGYSGEIYSDTDVLMKLLNEAESLIETPSKLFNFHLDIQESQCWRFGYYTKCNFASVGDADYDQNIAIIYWCLDKLNNLNHNEFLIKKPDFENVLPAFDDKTLESVEVFFKDK